MIKRSPFEYHYQFQFLNGQIKDYHITLDPDTLSMVPIASATGKTTEWVRLHFKQCRHCPLQDEGHANCPIAVNLMELVEAFKDLFSYHDCMVVCHTAERTYSKQTSIMEGLSAIFGIIMATSDCPVMEFLKPMARFHLPFATIEETTVRTASMYLLAQYFKSRNQSEMRCDFKALEEHYSRVQVVNEGLLERIHGVTREDADINAIVTLHSLSQFLSMEIDYSLSGLAYIFAGRYMD
ncbi:DUF6901 family protein [Desulfatitalea alkaliphila]|uniref:Uncharacterized protein n=1 Tax=Desulfatitalea alkaliphila TaxID=2929485 RepID=A0AA41R1X0_9BACT|nr:hypothetical protein [Desulfatitalea alkaliphila]MCJ8500514.1 hypothetical protein [Desulfatitalea alkaliphila]